VGTIVRNRKECAQILFIIVGIWKETEITYLFLHVAAHQTETEMLTMKEDISSLVLGVSSVLGIHSNHSAREWRHPVFLFTQSPSITYPEHGQDKVRLNLHFQSFPKDSLVPVSNSSKLP
jgi:hypothetical protein